MEPNTETGEQAVAPTERTVEIEDAELLELVTKKGEMVEEGRGFAREMERLAEEHKAVHEKLNEKGVEVDELKRKIIARLKDVAGHHVGEFEVPVTTSLKDGKIVFTIADAKAEFENSFKSFDKWKEAQPIAGMKKEPKAEEVKE